MILQLHSQRESVAKCCGHLLDNKEVDAAIRANSSEPGSKTVQDVQFLIEDQNRPKLPREIKKMVAAKQ